VPDSHHSVHLRVWVCEQKQPTDADHDFVGEIASDKYPQLWLPHQLAALSNTNQGPSFGYH
jgi:hypothetical protein